MLTLELKIPAKRDALAVATLRDNDKIFHTDHAVATASPANAARLKNPACDPRRIGGHPPLGRYNLLGRARATGAQQAEYGNELFLFDPQYGDAYAAISHGRMGLLACGGALGADNLMRRTQGGIRLTNKMIAAILKHLGNNGDMNLTLVELIQPSWWQFWKRKIATPQWSTTELKPIQNPNDEISVIDALIKRFGRKPAYGASTLATDDDRRNERRDDNTSTYDNDRSSSSSSNSFSGGGGQSGGGGASGAWDNSGRIPAGAAAGAAAGLAMGVVAAAAVTAAAAGEFDTGARDSGTSTGTGY